jgi:hypothetical protein
MSIRRLLFQWTSTIKIQLDVLVLYKVDFIISLKINLFSPWNSWKIAELALNNNYPFPSSQKFGNTYWITIYYRTKFQVTDKFSSQMLLISDHPLQLLKRNAELSRIPTTRVLIDRAVEEKRWTITNSHDRAVIFHLVLFIITEKWPNCVLDSCRIFF